MKCSICSTKTASVQITQQADGSSTTVHLCKTCATKMGVNDPAGFSLATLLSAVEVAGNRRLKRKK
jgi:protein-arginine kinase activator protein McsA